MHYQKYKRMANLCTLTFVSIGVWQTVWPVKYILISLLFVLWIQLNVFIYFGVVLRSIFYIILRNNNNNNNVNNIYNDKL